MKNAFLREDDTKKALADFILRSTKFSMGEKCLEFERKFALYQNRKYAVLFNSGGSANLALLQALKSLKRLKEGGRIGFSALTWSTNVMPILQMGMTPVPLDCSIETLNVMSGNLESRLQEIKLDAFFTTNVLGLCGDLSKIRQICDTNNIIFLEDNCESLGAELPENKAGNFGLAATFSFYVAHHMSTIEGGMVCTDNESLYNMLKMTRANGWDRDLSSDEQNKLRAPYQISEFAAKYSFFDLGFNLRPTEITGFLGVEQLQYLEENIRIRNKNHQLFEQVISGNEELLSLQHSYMDQVSPFALVILCKTPQLREKYIRRFLNKNIEIRPVIAGNMQRQPFYGKYVSNKYDLENTDFIHSCGFYCGNYPELSEDDIATIISCLTNTER